MPLAATWMDLEIIILCQRRKKYTTYMWNPKNETSELL